MVGITTAGFVARGTLVLSAAGCRNRFVAAGSAEPALLVLPGAVIGVGAELALLSDSSKLLPALP